MAEPLKNSFGHDIPDWIATRIVGVMGDFDVHGFAAACLDGFDDLELTPRARHVAAAMATFLPADRQRALEILVDSLGPEDEELVGMEGFRYLPYVFFVADHGLDHFEAAMTTQYELTKRFTAEFSIRAYIERHPEATMARLRTWATDPSDDVRRLVSEGTRTRLPWAPRLRLFQADPSPVIDLLEMLKDDPSEYVRRSVANNLNDIAKDHPDIALEVAERWWADADDNRRRLIRHALRTLIKAGDAAALAVLGYGVASPAVLGSVVITPTAPAIGEKIRLEAEVRNPSEQPVAALVDLRVHFVKANGSTSAKVFKGAELELDPMGSKTIRKTISLAQQSTRTHYPGHHRVEILINGVACPAGSFDLSP